MTRIQRIALARYAKPLPKSATVALPVYVLPLYWPAYWQESRIMHGTPLCVAFTPGNRGCPCA